MIPRVFLCLALTVLPGAAAADAVECALTPTSDTGLTGGTLRVYSYKGAVHSAFLQTRTEYGDDLPYVFFCQGGCQMNMGGHDYVYTLRVSPSLRSPARVSLITTAREDQFQTVDAFQVQSCRRMK